MQSPSRRHRPQRKHLSTAVHSDALTKAAGAATYVGSVEHKIHYTWLGVGRPRTDATPCPRELKEAEQITEWLRDAIESGQVSDYWEGDFPRYAWGIRDGQPYEARLMNSGNGEYKGYPIEFSQLPRGLT